MKKIYALTIILFVSSELADSKIDVSQLQSGTYMIEVVSEGKTITKKFIKE